MVAVPGVDVCPGVRAPPSLRTASRAARAVETVTGTVLRVLGVVLPLGPPAA